MKERLRAKQGIFSFFSACIFALFFNVSSFFAQQNQIGIGGGLSYYTGDINQIPFASVQENALLFYRFVTPLQRWNFRANFSYIHISGQDKNAKNSFQNQRNLDFDTRIFQLSALIEFNFLPYATVSNGFNYVCSPYVVLGVSGLYFLPRGTIGSGWGNLYQRDTERANFSDLAFALPLGLGVKTKLFNNWGLALEYLIHVPFTAYLDGIQKRGNGVVTDLFYQLSLQLYYTLPPFSKACKCLKR
jgi:hypothetical protein